MLLQVKVERMKLLSGERERLDCSSEQGCHKRDHHADRPEGPQWEMKDDVKMTRLFSPKPSLKVGSVHTTLLV